MREFPHNHWWIAARAEDVGRDLLERVVLGTPMVLYRTLDGRAVALDNRCAHRGYALSRGTLFDDELRCNYHGFRYDTTGACVAIPSQRNIPSRACVKSYPVVEHHPFVWVWIGDDAAADPALMPDPGWVEDEWAVLSGSMHIDGSWHVMHDNLLDLTHLTFLHNGVGGTEAYAQVPPEVESKNGRLQVHRRYVDDSPGAGWSLGITTPIERETTTYWRSPALLVVEVKVHDLEARARGEQRNTSLRFVHGISPETSASLNYHWVVARDFMTDNDDFSKMLSESTMVTFEEDRDVLETLQRMADRYPQPDGTEISVKTDGAGLQARRLIRDVLQT